MPQQRIEKPCVSYTDHRWAKQKGQPHSRAQRSITRQLRHWIGNNLTGRKAAEA